MLRVPLVGYVVGVFRAAVLVSNCIPGGGDKKEIVWDGPRGCKRSLLKSGERGRCTWRSRRRPPWGVLGSSGRGGANLREALPCGAWGWKKYRRGVILPLSLTASRLTERTRRLHSGKHSRVFFGSPAPTLTCRDLLEGFSTGWSPWPPTNRTCREPPPLKKPQFSFFNFSSSLRGKEAKMTPSWNGNGVLFNFSHQLLNFPLIQSLIN